MSTSLAEPLLKVAKIYIDEPTSENRAALIAAADDYREHWIVAQAQAAASRKGASGPGAATSYDRHLEVARVVDGIPVKLALQKRTSASAGESWWTLSWRTKYSADGSNRRFYLTTEDCWTIPAPVALEMFEEMEGLGGLSEEYFDHRGNLSLLPVVSESMQQAERSALLGLLVGPDEDWGSDPYFVVCSDSSPRWKKVLIVNTGTNMATFRSTTTDPDYMPKKVLRPGAGWWLDNSMMDASVQQARAFRSALQDYLARRPNKKRTK